MTQELFSTRAQSTLVGGINNIQTTLEVTSASSFPTTGNFRIMVDDEILLVTSVSGAIFTVTRGVESTLAAVHTGGTGVFHILTAGALQAHVADLCKKGAYASDPWPTGRPLGSWYFPDDATRIINITEVVGLRPLIPCVGVLDTWLNQYSATADETHGFLHLSTPYDAFGGIQARLQAVSAPVTHIAAIIPDSFSGQGTARWGMIWYRSGGGADDNSLLLCASCSTAYQYLSRYSFASTSSGSGSFITNPDFGNGHPYWPDNICWLKGVYDGTDLTFYISIDGYNWQTDATPLDVASYLGGAPEYAGIFISHGSSPFSTGVSVIHWE